ncbi:MAG: potassium-transporting ATPase subunit A [Planctomycetales bacterium]|nr:potassium-transporting ATPase subunit A [Planctomycetales bacterium]
MNTWFLPILIISAAIAIAWPLSRYMQIVFDDRSQSPIMRRWHQWLGWGLGENDATTTWASYCRSMLAFNFGMFAIVFGVLAFQDYLPLNPDKKVGLEPTLAFNTAISFVTNTNLQHYSGEAALSYFSQLSLMWLQFVSAATGLAVLVAVARVMAGAKSMGDFYRDVASASFLVLLPLSIMVAICLSIGGVPMTLSGAVEATTLEGATQTLARGPVAAFVAIKQLGTNGGGFYGPNSTHPLENPTYWTNIISNFCIIVIPMACVWLFGRMTGRIHHAHAVFGVMLVLFVGFIGYAGICEQQSTRALDGLPITSASSLEGKELRFGAIAGPLWAVSTTSTSNGSVNAMHDSLNPLTSIAPLTGMWLNVEFGGVGVGMLNMFMFIVVSVFLAGMMVGRTPEYLARKIEAFEIKLALLTILSHPLFILGGTALFAATAWGKDTISNPGSHGLTQIVYEFTSAAANNGSGFEGLGDNTPAWNIATGLVMLFARFIPIIAPLAIAGSLSSKRATPEGAGTFRTDSWMFGVILLGTVLIVGALLFLPLAVLGPIAEQLRPS